MSVLRAANAPKYVCGPRWEAYSAPLTRTWIWGRGGREGKRGKRKEKGGRVERREGKGESKGKVGPQAKILATAVVVVEKEALEKI